MAFVFFAPPWQVDEQGGNRYKGKTTQTSTNESDSVQASPVILQPYRVPKCDVIENEICEITGFVKIFSKNNVQDAYSPKISNLG